jgi:three-Cys-motif partner protein
MLDEDGLPLDEVGVWAKEKHERLRKYVDISRAARKKFVEGSGGAAYIDPFCGSGAAVVRETGERIDGSPLVAFKSAVKGGVSFSQLQISDFNEDRCRAAEMRLIEAGVNPSCKVGPAEQTIVQIVDELNPYGLHFAFLDPYNLRDLPFSIFEALSKLNRIDILLHFSVQDLQRNIDAYTASDDDTLERFAPGWRSAVNLKQSQGALRAAVVQYWSRQLKALGLPAAKHAELVSGTAKNQRLYWLIFLSRSDFAKGLWEKIRNIKGQGELF